jgi:hypothetical protein
MDARERIIRALARKDGDLPDRVPIFVEGMMKNFGKKSEKQFGKEFGLKERIRLNKYGRNWKWPFYYKFDSFWLHSTPIHMNSLLGKIGRKPKKNGKTQYLTRWGHFYELSYRKSTGFTSWYTTGHLNTKELWKEWIDAGYFEYKVSNSWIRKWEKKYPKICDKGLVLVPVDTIFEKIREAFTLAKFAYFLRKERAFIENLTHRIFKIGMEYVKGCCDAGFDIISIADDTAYKNRVMYSPKIFEELVAPRYKELIDYIHKRGCLTFYHSDGFTEPFFPGLIKAGFDGIQSLEPAAGMDLKHLKETYGDRVTLIGNLDCSQLLPFGTQNEVRFATKKCLAAAMSNGGYICGPTTDITDSCNPLNIKAMVETVHQHGWY